MSRLWSSSRCSRRDSSRASRGYLAPEQALGRETTAASDRYALAVVAYELLTGGRPFARGSETAEAAAQIHDPVPPASERAPWLPPQVDRMTLAYSMYTMPEKG